MANIVQMSVTANKIQLLQHLPYSLDVAPKDYFFFWRVKEVLADTVLTPESFKKIWEWVVRTIGIDKCVIACRR
jgi:hypothetical protein